ncbi:cobalamin-binding protein [Alteribacter keqinensis]|uniref:Cobalamin-binding protein n=1 Tax=Alteribacter keqinensis TaxID=2483800 RepID=A0A3M7TV36_9BACI|nr:cobalamin-binding protein [Alteribacter keqinensis]RNA69313.1 cobalamin-binding protein [Alteribacter keqinensis]
MKYISLCPSNTELLHYLDLIPNVAGVDDFSDWPDTIKELPRLGPDLNINMDKLESLKPDLVFASLSVPGMEKNIEELNMRNIPYVIVPNPRTLKEVADAIRFVGRESGRTEKAEELAEKFNEILHQYESISREINYTYSIYWEWWPKPVFTPGHHNWLTEISRLAGGENVFSDKETESVQTEWTDVLKRDPDVVAVVWVGVQQSKVNKNVILKRPGWNDMNAIKYKRLFVLDEPLFCRPSPRLLLGLSKLASILHPEKYPLYTGEDLLLK